MSIKKELHVDDLGTPFVVQIKELIDGVDEIVDLSAVTEKKLHFKHIETGVVTSNDTNFASDYIVWLYQSAVGSTGNKINSETIVNRFVTVGDFLGGDVDLKAKSVISVGDLRNDIVGSDIGNDEGFTLKKADDTTVVFKFSLDSGVVTGEDVTISILTADTKSQLASKIQAAIDGHADFSAVVVNGRDGKIKYVTEAATLNVSGKWKLQAELAWGASRKLKTDVGIFYVYPNL